MPINICFILYPWEKIAPVEDSSIRLIHEACMRGHNVGIVYPNNLSIRKSITTGYAKIIRKSEKSVKNISTFYKNTKFREQSVPLAGFDVVFVRTNPPLDPVMLNFLDSVRHDTFIINDIDGLRKANNKLYPAAFEDPENEIIPKTYVSKNVEFLRKVIRGSESEKMILKPFDGFGGSGVIVLEKGAMQNINSILDFYINSRSNGNYVILQDYVKCAQTGDVRVLMLHGEPIGAYRRVPPADDVRSNIKAGGSAVKHSLTKQEKDICRKIGARLVADGLYFVGLDIIGGKLIEINVCSPGGITRINRFNRTRLQEQVIDFVENVVHLKEAAIDRKRSFRTLIENA